MTAPLHTVIEHLKDAGAYNAGVVRACPVADEEMARLEQWRREGCHAGMEWMERNDHLRRDPRLLLDGARSLIVCLFNYHTPEQQPRPSQGSDTQAAPRIAAYARGRDYHIFVRERLVPVCRWLEDYYGGETRICTDSAPLRERYWAEQAGLGFRGRNGQLTVPGDGAAFFIATILWTGSTDSYSEPYSGPGCGTCRRCIDACPTHALRGDGTLDCRRCLSYLTIESRTDIPADIPLNGNLFGCDACRLACPHSHAAPVTTLPELLTPHPAATLSLDEYLSLGIAAFRRLTAGSPLSRVRLPHLKATALRLTHTPDRRETKRPGDQKAGRPGQSGERPSKDFQ